MVFKDLDLLLESINNLIKLIADEERIKIYSFINYFKDDLNKYMILILAVKFYNHSTFVQVRLSSEEFEKIT